MSDEERPTPTASATSDGQCPTPLTHDELRIIAAVQRFTASITPFRDAAVSLGMSEEDVLSTCRSMVERGAIRRFAASVAHRRSGFNANPMTILKVPEEEIEHVGTTIAADPGVTHCYHRSGWDYTIFFMIHDRTRESAISRVKDILGTLGKDYPHKIVFSSREFKKVSFEIEAPSVMDTDPPVRNEDDAGGTQ